MQVRHCVLRNNTNTTTNNNDNNNSSNHNTNNTTHHETHATTNNDTKHVYPNSANANDTTTKGLGLLIRLARRPKLM